MSKLAASSPIFEPWIGLKSAMQQLAVEHADPADDDAVDVVARVAGDVDLGGEQLAVPLLHLEVDVGGGPAGVGDRLDGAEAVLAGRAGGEPAEPLEVLVLLVLLGVAVAGVEVDLVGVALPDLDRRVADRAARRRRAPGRSGG